MTSESAAIVDRRAPSRLEGRLPARRIAPVLVAAAFAIAYVIVSPPSLDLAAHLLRAKLFATEGFGLWDNWWYAGHHVPGYSVLFPPVAALLTPQVAGGIAAVGSAALFEPLARGHFGERAWLGTLWFGAATATDLFTGRLTFAFGLLPAIGCALALQRGRPRLAASLGGLTALASPVAALFSTLAGISHAVGALSSERRIRAVVPGLGVVAASLAPVLALAVAFPEGGSEPFSFATLWPIALVGAVALLALPRREATLRAGVALYTLGCIVAYAVATPIGSNAARLGPLVAGPLAAMLWWPRRKALVLLTALPLLYLQWQAPIRDLRTSAGDQSVRTAYYQPLLSFLGRQPGPPFRVEIPFTRFHWEAYVVAPRYPLARGWERQLDIKDNPLFYTEPLTPATYDAWLHKLAVRFVAVPDAPVDFSTHKEVALIDRGLPYLRLALRTTHWRVFAVADPTPIVQGPASLRAFGPNSLTLQASQPGTVLVRVRFTPYWALGSGSGCVTPAGEFTALTLRRPGPVRLVIRFSLGRIGARSPRCS